MRLLTEPTTTDNTGQRVSVAGHLDPSSTLNFPRAHLYVHNLLKHIFEDYVGLGDSAYVAASERFEYLRLVQATYDRLKTEGREREAVADETLLQDLESKAKDISVSEGLQPEHAKHLVEGRSATQQRRRERQYRAPVGLPHIFVIRHTDSHPATTASDLDAQILREAGEHPLLRAGLCGGDLDAMRTAMQAVDDALDEVANQAVWSLGSGWIPSEFYPDEIGKWAKASP